MPTGISIHSEDNYSSIVLEGLVSCRVLCFSAYNNIQHRRIEDKIHFEAIFYIGNACGFRSGAIVNIEKGCGFRSEAIVSIEKERGFRSKAIVNIEKGRGFRSGAIVNIEKGCGIRSEAPFDHC